MDGENNKAADSLKAFKESVELNTRLNQIKHKIMVLSGKGGVGKSTVAANIAVALAMEGKKVGLLDTDFHGPSIPTLLNLEGVYPEVVGEKMLPVQYNENLSVMSIGFLVPNKDDAVIWRGPMKMNVIKQLLTDVEWGVLDYLIIDFPPGTGDEPLSVAQLIPGIGGAIIVTTPQNLSLNDVRKCINFCKQVNVPVTGVVENMSGLICPHCGKFINVFKTGGGEKMAAEMGVPFLGTIPLDPRIVETSDNGEPFVSHFSDTEAAKAFRGVVQPILVMSGGSLADSVPAAAVVPAVEKALESKPYRIAIPVTEGVLSAHFGHCDVFDIFDVDLDARKIIGRETAPSPPHEPGLLPRWLSEKGANLIIAGGMGPQAQQLFTANGVDVFLGAASEAPEKVVASYLANSLDLGSNTCDHHDHDH
jgi:Mrp family chromosome partitioning ATPase/predicted Fe-Mo cluster-binding NifX family protein